MTLSFDEPVTGLTEAQISLVEDTSGITLPDHVYMAAAHTSARLIFEGGLPDGNYTLKVLDSVTDLAGNELDGDRNNDPGGDFELEFAVGTAVVGRHFFYNNSYFDTATLPNTDFTDHDAVAPGKTALMPGGTATFANYTSYSLGINGIMIDIAGPPATPEAADFRFKVGNDPQTRLAQRP